MFQALKNFQILFDNYVMFALMTLHWSMYLFNERVTYHNCIIYEPRHEKNGFCICKNKADQLRGNREADQCLCLSHMDSTFPLLPKSEISSIKTYSVIVQSGL